ncbi:MAG: alpha-glucosidase [Pseudobutyrivibrio ruminis]|nr:alpha-glucosidase [Pseudobutyrivibrio ruminis]
MKLNITDSSFSLENRGRAIFSYSNEKPFIYVGKGKEDVLMYRGNFKIDDYLIERIPLLATQVKETSDGLEVEFGTFLKAKVTVKEDLCTINFEQLDKSINRFWIRMDSYKSEHIYGCGEQMSYFDLKGRHFPLWTSEPGVGRDKTTYITWKGDVDGMSGGDYYNTNFPQPTYVSSDKFYVHVQTTAYADFDFRNDEFSELQIWEIPKFIRIEAAASFVELLEKETAFFGRQPKLPDWVYNGLIIGAQGGNERAFGILEKSLEKGIKVSGLWCQDWCGKRVTSFGKRLQWDWHFHEEMYPNLPEKIKEIHDKDIKYLGYINPYLVKDGKLFEEGLKKDVFAKKSDGSVYLVDFGEFDCGVIDLTNPTAYEWFKDEVIKKYSIDIGIDGWMADFGEYLPTDDIILSSGKPAMIEHNHWPALWAKCNYDAVSESGKLGEVVYFMRAGGIGSQKYCTLLWAGDQSVDFTRHDGLCTVICAALSSGMSGCGLNHSDIGGYTSLYDNLRTKEVFLRWAEMAAFTPVMRTHEGNRPDTNFQYYDDEDCMKQLARLTDIYVAITPLLKELVEENSLKGTPVQRPLFMHYAKDERCFTEQFEYLLGEDVLVAPVYEEGKVERKVFLPEDGFVHLWTGKEFSKGECVVEAQLGDTPVFYKKGSKYSELFENIRKQYGR